jgi:uncharacterized protein YcbK (DUF882 family)
MSSEPSGTAAPELTRMRRELARKRREPIRIIIATDPSRPVRTLTIPRALPAVLLAFSAILVLSAIALSFSTWSMSDTVASLRNRVLAMVQAADTTALHTEDLRPRSTAQDGTPGQFDGLAAHLRKPNRSQGRFVLEASNSGERVEVVLDLASGDMEEGSYRAVRRLMRCRRTGAETPIDPRLVEMLFKLSQRTNQRVQLISGYRAPAFAAPNSYHTRGMAADIRIPGMTALMVRDLARAMGVRGIGYYPRSQFVHVDLRDEPFFWTDLGTGEGGPDPELEGGGLEHGAGAGLVLDP